MKDCVYCVGTFVTMCPLGHDPGNPIFLHVLCLMVLSVSAFLLSCIILVDHSRTVDSVSPCTVPIGPSPPC